MLDSKSCTASRMMSVVGLLLLGPLPILAADSTLVRLSFWAPLERMGELEEAYAGQIVPILKKHGLAESRNRGRSTVDSVFSRLFALETAAAVAVKKQALDGDTTWQDALRGLGSTFGAKGADGFIRHRLSLYSAPVGEGTSVLAGSGTRHGLWRNFTGKDGLPTYGVTEMYQDGKGHLWVGVGPGMTRYDGTHFTTFGASAGFAMGSVSCFGVDRHGNMWIGTNDDGVVRFDGSTFTSFTTEDGLVHNDVQSIVEDRRGHLWFGTGGGASRYDGAEFTTFTTEHGLIDNRIRTILEDREGNLWFGTGWWGTEGSGVSRYDGQQFTNFTVKDGLADNHVQAMASDRHGNVWLGTQGGVSRYDGHRFTNFTTEDGLVHNTVRAVLEDRHGHLWFGTWSGLSRYDGQQFVTFSTQDGLANNRVEVLAEDPEGYLWVATRHGGLSRYDSVQFANFTVDDGLAGHNVMSIVENRNGDLWLGTLNGASRFDGKRFTSFTTEDGLADNTVWGALADSGGNLWFGTRSGASRYDGEEFVTFTTEDGLPNNTVWSIEEDRNGNLWFGTIKGAARYDGTRFTTFTTENTDGGLARNMVWRILEDSRGHIWFLSGSGDVSRYDGTRFITMDVPDARDIAEDRQGNLWFSAMDTSVTRYDGTKFTTFTTADGLERWVEPLMEDRDGQMWFGSRANGVSRFDGQVFQTLSRKDGLLNNTIYRFLQDRQGAIWIGTAGGLTRYRPQHKSAPDIQLTDVIADRSYGPVGKLRQPSSQSFITFEYHGRSMTTPMDGLIYRYRLNGFEDEWSRTRATRVTYRDLPQGEFIFQVKAIDRDLNHSALATVELTIRPPFGMIALVGVLSIALAGLVFASVTAAKRSRERDVARIQLAIKRRRDRSRQRRRIVEELEGELQTAHDMQMSLMPSKPPQAAGFELAGRCLPANQVGGDFYQYFDLSGDRVAVAMADVTGHAMEAAIPAVMFSGILDSQMETPKELEELFANLNRSLCRSLGDHTFVCFTMAEFDPSTGSLRVANGGCPYPLHYTATTGEVLELEIDTYPLGVNSATTYAGMETRLERNDYLVFCSDGIIEARNAAGDMFGFDGMLAAIREGCERGLTSEELIDHALTEVRKFAVDITQDDDQTIVVLKKE